MTPSLHEALDPQPFRDWCDRRLKTTDDAGVELGHGAAELTVTRLVFDLNISERRLHRWRFEVKSLQRAEVEEALHHADVGFWEVYPEVADPESLYEGYCTRCDEVVGATKEGRCTWCDGPIVRASSRAEQIVRAHTICIGCRGRKGRGSLRCKPCAVRLYPRANGKIAGGTVTPEMKICPGCGGPKSHDAMRCKSCFVKTGGLRGIRLPKGRLKRMSEELLAEARDLYSSGLDMPQVCERVFPRTEYPNTTACINGLYRAFRHRGWPMRSKSETNFRRWDRQRERERIAA